jgi:hypothetical protein
MSYFSDIVGHVKEIAGTTSRTYEFSGEKVIKLGRKSCRRLASGHGQAHWRGAATAAGDRGAGGGSGGVGPA